MLLAASGGCFFSGVRHLETAWHPKRKTLFMLLAAPGGWFFLTGSHPAGIFYLDIFPNFNNVLLSASYYFYGRFVHCSSNYAFNSFLSQFVF